MRSLILLLAIALTTTQAAAQQTKCTDPETQPTCTAHEAYDIYREAALLKLRVTTETTAAKKLDEQVTNSNRATDAPDAFAGRLHNTYQDFLNLFSFAINKIDESANGQALTVRFNPLREGSNLLGLTLTAARPTISHTVQNAIPEQQRSDVVAKLSDGLNDLSDLTVAGSYSLQTVDCSDARLTNRCYGRDPSTYRNVLAHALAPLFAASPPVNDARQHTLQVALATLVPISLLNQNPNLDLLTVQIAQATDPALFREKLKELADVEAQQTFDEKSFFAKQNLDGLSSLIDNQPQVAVTSSYRSPGKLGGPTQTALSAELQVGSENINAVRASCRPITDACLNRELMARLKNGVSTLKWVLTATFMRNDRFRVDSLDVIGAVPGFTAIDEKSSSELVVKGQGGQILGATIGTQNVRGDFSLEGHRVQKDRTRTANRWVATGTITLPLGGNISVPVSVTYANKPEFLGNQGKKLGAHLGLSYRLPIRPSVKQEQQ
jgi:hypothetical protein